LIGYTISTRSKRNISCAIKISSPSILSHDTNTLKVSEKTNSHDNYPKNFNHVLLSKPEFEGYRKNSNKQFEENQNYIDDKLHQDPDHPSTFMKIVKEITGTMSAINDERRQLLPSKIIWDGTIVRFEVFRNNIEDHYRQIATGYSFDSSFQEAH
jgi:translation initiation factor 2 beta subunit (eIF-2beta)/eIF-5